MSRAHTGAWQQAIDFTQQGHDFGLYSEVIARIVNWPTTHKDSVFATANPTIQVSAKQFFGEMMALAQEIQDVEGERDSALFFSHFQKVCNIWTTGLCETFIGTTLALKAGTLRDSPKRHFYQDKKKDVHIAISDNVTLAFSLLNAAYNHLFSDGHFMAFEEVASRNKRTLQPLLNQLNSPKNKTTANQSRLHSFEACNTYIATLPKLAAAAPTTAVKAKPTPPPRLDLQAAAAANSPSHQQKTSEPRPEHPVSATSGGGKVRRAPAIPPRPERTATATHTSHRLFPKKKKPQRPPASPLEEAQALLKGSTLAVHHELECILRAKSLIEEMEDYLHERQQSGHNQSDIDARKTSYRHIKGLLTSQRPDELIAESIKLHAQSANTASGLSYIAKKFNPVGTERFKAHALRFVEALTGKDEAEKPITVLRLSVHHFRAAYADLEDQKAKRRQARMQQRASAEL